MLLSLREGLGDDKADVIMKYYEVEAQELKELGEIPEHVKINEGDFFDEEDDGGLEEEKKEEDDFNVDSI